MSYKVVLDTGVVHELDTDDLTIRYVAADLQAGVVIGWSSSKAVARSAGYAVLDTWMPEVGSYILLPGDVVAIVTHNQGQYVHYQSEDGVTGKQHIKDVQGICEPDVFIYVVETEEWTGWEVTNEEQVLVGGYTPGSLVAEVRQALAALYRPVYDYLPASPGCSRHDIMAVDSSTVTDVYSAVPSPPDKVQWWKRK